MRSAWPILAIALLALPSAAQVQPAFVPLEVAVHGLEDALEAAIRDAEHRLGAAEAQQRLDDVVAYVDGFEQLPPGRAALADPRVREAYAWTQDVAGLLASFPSPVVATESAGAACDAYGAGIDRREGLSAVRNGTAGIQGARALRDEVAALLAEVPEGLDAGRLTLALGHLDDWLDDRAEPALDCLVDLRQELGVPIGLDAIIVPASTYPQGSFRVVGGGPEGKVVVEVPSLRLVATTQASDGAFAARLAVPANASLGSHAVRVLAGSLEVGLTLDVRRAPSSLALILPERTTPGPLDAIVRLRSPAGTAALEGAVVSVAFRGATTVVPLVGGEGVARLDATEEGSFVLQADYAGTNGIAPAAASTTVVVAPAASPSPPPAVGRAGAWSVVLLAIVVVACLGLAAWAVRAASRRAPVDQQAQPNPAEGAEWLEASTFSAALAGLLLALRRLRLVPAGTTAREWVRAVGGPGQAAQTFDRVRYGGAPEAPADTAAGKGWLARGWARWRR